MKDNKWDFLWNYKENCIRGWFINALLTFTIMILIVIGAFVESVCNNLVSMAGLIDVFFASSLGIWSVKKHFDDKVEYNNMNRLYPIKREKDNQ